MDPADEKNARRRALNAAIPPLILTVIIWGIFLLEKAKGWDLSPFGIYPGKWEGLTGILTAPFIHGDIGHLVNNSVPLLVMGWAIFYFYRPIAFQVLPLIQLFSGIWVWISARPSYHIGASGLIYGMLSFIFFSGILRKDSKLIALSLLITFLYGSMFWGILPIKSGISWEGHLWGAIAGVLLAFHYRRRGPQRPYYQWELEELEEMERAERKRKEGRDLYIKGEADHTWRGRERIVYHYRKTGGNEKGKKG